MVVGLRRVCAISHGNADAPCEHVLRDTECHDTMFASHVRVKGVVRGSFGFRFLFLFQKKDSSRQEPCVWRATQGREGTKWPAEAALAPSSRVCPDSRPGSARSGARPIGHVERHFRQVVAQAYRQALDPVN